MEYIFHISLGSTPKIFSYTKSNMCDDVLRVIFSEFEYSDICNVRLVCRDWAVAGKERLDKVNCKLAVSIEEAVCHAVITRDMRHLNNMLKTNLDAEQILRGCNMASSLGSHETFNKFVQHNNWKYVRMTPIFGQDGGAGLNKSMREFLYKPLSWCVKNISLDKYNLNELASNRCYRLVRFLLKDKPIPEALKRYRDLWTSKRYL